MTNQPYVKQLDNEGNITNPITQSNPYLHRFPTTSYRKSILGGKFTVYHHPTTGEYLGKVKTNGNNRKNTCTRKGKNSRNTIKV
jgi:hypothetical protein